MKGCVATILVHLEVIFLGLPVMPGAVDKTRITRRVADVFYCFFRATAFTGWQKRRQASSPIKKWEFSPMRRRNSFWLLRGEMWRPYDGKPGQRPKAPIKRWTCCPFSRCEHPTHTRPFLHRAFTHFRCISEAFAKDSVTHAMTLTSC